jgi:hypothetical protein
MVFLFEVILTLLNRTVQDGTERDRSGQKQDRYPESFVGYSVKCVMTHKQHALAEAAAHVRMHGLERVDDWAYTLAVAWGFEDDEKFIDEIAQHMQDIFGKEGKLPRVPGPNRRGKRDNWNKFLYQQRSGEPFRKP